MVTKTAYHVTNPIILSSACREHNILILPAREDKSVRRWGRCCSRFREPVPQERYHVHQGSSCRASCL